MVQHISGHQLIKELSQLIIKIIIKDQERVFFKRLKHTYEEAVDNSGSLSPTGNGTSLKGQLFTEQVKEVLRKTLHEFLTDFLIGVLDHYIAQEIEEP